MNKCLYSQYLGFQFYNPLLKNSYAFMPRMFILRHSMKIFRAVITFNAIEMMYHPVFWKSFIICFLPINNVFGCIKPATLRLFSCPNMRRIAANIDITIDTYSSPLPCWTIKTLRHIGSVTFYTLAWLLLQSLNCKWLPASNAMMQPKFFNTPLMSKFCMMFRVASIAIFSVGMSIGYILSTFFTMPFHINSVTPFMREVKGCSFA